MMPFVNYSYIWLNNTHYLQNQQDVYEFDELKATLKFNLLVDSNDGIIVCNDKLILKANTQQVNRHSTKADYFSFQDGANVPIQQEVQVMGCLYYVKENSLYAIKDNRLIEQGTESKLVGVTDWVYEEELFMVSKAFKESKDGSNDLLYSVFDDTDVKDMPILLEDENYPKITNWKYPRPGTPNPKNSLYFLHDDHKYLIFESDDDLCSDYIHFKHFIIFKVLNRVQSQLSYFALDTSQLNISKKELVVSYTAPWFEAQRSLSFYAEDYFLDIINHVLIIASFAPIEIIYSTGDLKTWDGDYDVTEIVCFNKNRVIYSGTKDRNLGSMQRHIYQYDLSHKSNTRITDHYLNYFDLDIGDDAYFEAKAHSDCNAVIIKYLGPNCIFESIYDLNAQVAKVVNNKNKDNAHNCPHLTLNNKSNKTSSNYGNVRITREQIVLENSTINTMTLYPPNFKIGQQFPVLFYPYQGPDSQSADFKFLHIDQFKHLLLQNGFVIIVADGSGTCCLGPANKYKVNREIGTFEAKDQINLAKYISLKTWANEHQICYFGWSYGGYLGLKIAELDTEGVFKAITSVAPVTDWLLYDTIYTERYMGLPSENANGYSISKINPNSGFKSALMICHGTGDDNVHFQQTLHVLADIFQNKNMDISIMPYPDVRHGMGGYRMHLYKQVLLFYGEKALFVNDAEDVRSEKMRKLFEKQD